MPQVVFVLSLFCGQANQHSPDLDHIYHTKGAARKARIDLFRQAKAEGVTYYDWDYWWSVSYECKVHPNFPKSAMHRVYYDRPKDECGILIEECIVND